MNLDFDFPVKRHDKGANRAQCPISWALQLARNPRGISTDPDGQILLGHSLASTPLPEIPNRIECYVSSPCEAKSF
jgi:hypothetical protein